tara:strand:- start:387 stop:560 length:174 start_codon:yes stop_codon:yes gene_type:complete
MGKSTKDSIIKFTLNEEDQKGSVYFSHSGLTKKQAFVDFQYWKLKPLDHHPQSDSKY